MANLRGTVQGYTLDGRPHRGEGSRLGHGSLRAKVGTWRTLAVLTMDKDGRLVVTVERDGKALYSYNLDTKESDNAKG